MSAGAQPRPEPGVLQLAAPLVVSFWMRAAFTFVDTLFAATVGDAAVAAIGLSLPFEFVMIAVWVGLSTGLTSNLARAMGAGRQREVEQHLAVSRQLVLAMVPLFTALGAWIAWDGARLGPDPATGEQFRIYGAVLVGGSAFTMFWSVVPDSIVKAHHDTRSTMWAGIWSNLINVALNTIFTFGLGWGVFGIALSTVLGRFGGLIYALRRAAHHERRRLAESGASDSSAHPTPWRATLGLAVPGALAFGLMAFETALINWLLARRSGGPEAITAFAIYFRVYQFMAMPAVATAVAILPFVAKRAGAGDYDGVRRGLVVAHRAGLVYVLLTAPLLWIGADPLAELLSDSPLARQLAREGLRAIPLLVLLSLPGILVRPAFEGLGLGRPGLILAALRHLLLLAPAVGAAIVLAERLSVSPLRGVLAGLATASALSAVIASAWIARTLSARISAENTRRALGRASG